MKMRLFSAGALLILGAVLVVATEPPGRGPAPAKPAAPPPVAGPVPVAVPAGFDPPPGPGRIMRGPGPVTPVPDFPPPELPVDAKKLVEDFDKKVADVQSRVEEEMRKERLSLIAELKKLQDDFCKKGMLDEAVAIRDQIRALHGRIVNATPFPGAVPAGPESVGKSFVYEVVARPGGSVWGTDIYTTDSHLPS